MKEYIKISHIKIGQNSSGEDILVKKLSVKGKSTKAKKVYIQSSMHASEIQGNAVILALLNHFNKYQPLGNVVIIPQCNPMGRDTLIGAGHAGRFDLSNGENWNRCYFRPEINYSAFATQYLQSNRQEYANEFRKIIKDQITESLQNPFGLSRAKSLNYKIQLEALEADIILDLHTDTYAIDYIYSPQYAKEDVKNFDFGCVLLMENKCNGALDEASFYPWWNLQQSFEKVGRYEPVLVNSYTLELGSEESINSKKAKLQAQKILNYLANQNVISSDDYVDTDANKHINFYDENLFRAIYAQSGGLYEWFVHPGDKFVKHQVIGQLLQMTQEKVLSISYPFDGSVVSINGKGALQKGSHLLNVIVEKF